MMKKYLAFCCCALLFSACNESEEDSRLQSDISRLEQKMGVKKGDFNFQSEYDLNLSNRDYLHFLNIIDTGSIYSTRRFWARG